MSKKIFEIKDYPERVRKAIIKEWEAYNLTQPGWLGDPNGGQFPDYRERLLEVKPGRLYKNVAKSSLVTNIDPRAFWKAILLDHKYDLLIPYYFPCEEEFQTITVDDQIYNI